MDVSMLGVGCGYDVKGAGQITVYKPADTEIIYQIADCRESWVESIRLLIDSYFNGTKTTVFDYSLIRPAGLLIKGFGGISSGPEPLKELHEAVRTVLYLLDL
jgi:ribonucleotide reductase alpha subunit